MTPPRYGERVARSFANGRYLLLPGRGHNDTDSCVSEIIQAFVTAGGVEGLSTACLAESRYLSFVLQADELSE